MLPGNKRTVPPPLREGVGGGARLGVERPRGRLAGVGGGKPRPGVVGVPLPGNVGGGKPRLGVGGGVPLTGVGGGKPRPGVGGGKGGCDC